MLFLVLSLILLWVHLGAYQSGLLQTVYDLSRGLIHRTLVLNTLLMLGTVAGVLLWYERLSLPDIGIAWEKLPFAVLFGIGAWLLIQGLEAVVSLIATGGTEIDPAWKESGLATIGLLIGMLFGTALWEEIAFRGFLLRQCFLKFGHWINNNRVLLAVVAILISQMAFALFHVPWKLMTNGMSLYMVGELAGVLLTGVLYALLYLRTGNLFLVIIIHALGNAPTSLVAPTIGTPNLLLLFMMLLLIFWPRMKKWEATASLILVTPFEPEQFRGEKDDNSIERD